MKILTDFIYRSNFLSTDFCDSLVDDIKKNTGWYKHSYQTTGNHSAAFPSEDFETLHSSEQHRSVLLPYINSAINNYNEFLFNNNSYDGYQSHSGVSICSNIKFNRCRVNSKIHAHHDHIHELFGKDNRSIPVLSIVGLLNNDFDGGEFIMFADNNMNLEKGDILIFPSTFLYPHSVNKLKSGVRYSFVSWAF